MITVVVQLLDHNTVVANLIRVKVACQKISPGHKHVKLVFQLLLLLLSVFLSST